MQEIEQNLKIKLEVIQKEVGSRFQGLTQTVRESERVLLEFEERKSDRSEMDKSMHLTSLLAIEFELIKKRFINFESDYNMVWKEISTIYTHQEDLRSFL